VTALPPSSCVLVEPPQPGPGRLYVSCATPGSKHWRVDLLEADTPHGLAAAPAVTVLPGSDRNGVKDPVVLHDRGRWHLWASVHPLESWDDADRMTTDYATSPDGLDWTWHGTVLTGRPGQWDARGVRVTNVHVQGEQLVVTYDGRATAAPNWEASGATWGSAVTAPSSRACTPSSRASRSSSCWTATCAPQRHRPGRRTAKR